MTAARANAASAEIARMLATLAFVAVNAALIVMGLGALPRLVSGDAGPHRAATMQEAERRLGTRIVLPGYYPARLAWPPAILRINCA